MSHEGYHEPYGELSPLTKDLHRALVSLQEELEAVDWYQQRVDATPDDALKAVLAHNRDEEIEHAIMTLEWIRRRVPKFDENMRTYLFTELPITEVEDEMKDGEDGGSDAEDRKEKKPSGGKSRKKDDAKGSSSSEHDSGSLGIGSLASTATTRGR